MVDNLDYQLEELLAKNCILASSTISSENVELFVGGGLAIGYCTSPHNFENKNRVVISGLSTESFADLNGTQNILIHKEFGELMNSSTHQLTLD